VTAPRIRARLEALIADEPSGAVVAVGWATVELDRAEAELGMALVLPSGAFVKADDSVALGARCRVARAALDPGIAVVLVEPSMEGRLAAWLARFGEGAVGLWLGTAPRPGTSALAPEQPGPLGPERLVLDGSRHGPYRLFVRPPGTIDP
jgi:hypothetical protein